ncbi:MAG: glycerol acyltransferase [Bacteroidetes bacterium]|nr:MAG: glycerol acyltransferase [Bacteroidota bacterium]MBL1145410.1 glycerol acyltransferase [Bacteroidota bacterium]NOG58208.1 glycerol acyltransferase [Bacteroidota bacterium]
MNFDDIRPYTDQEVNEKIQRLVEEPQFQQVMEQINPEVPFKILKMGMLRINTIKDFQTKIIVPMLEKLINQSTDGLSGIGLENLEKDKRYLFVSTHRDIALDSALMDYVLLKNGFETVEIAIGDNLMTIPWVVDLVKLNKTFIVKRSLSKEKKAAGSLELSSYIHHALKEKKESIWIAQKAGRSKDGNDRTNPSIIKMFSLAGQPEKIIENLKSLNICPVSISYEFNPCDILTMPELMALANGEKYEKAPMEDLMQMAEGITGKKGKVVVSFGKPINSEIEKLKEFKNSNDFFAKVAKLIDNQIHNTYSLTESNYIAHDLINQTNRFANEYSEVSKANFESYMSSRLEKVEGDANFIKEVFLKMYAYPVKNKLESI